jgi:hypothetical protein
MAHQIGAAHLPIGVLGIAHAQIDVSGTAAAQSLAAFARNPNRLASLDAFGDSHLVGFRLFLAGAGIGSPHRNGSHGPLEHFIERDENVALNVLAPQGLARGSSGRWLLVIERRTAARSAGASAKELFKKITETRALKLEIIFITPGSLPADRPPARPGGGRDSPPVFQSAPSWSNFRRLSGLLKTSLASLISLNFSSADFFVLGDIRMILPRERAESLLDFLVRRLGRHPQDR